MSRLPIISGFDSGYPLLLPPWYGLWCPLLDCFLWLGCDLARMRKTQELTISKTLTVLVQLDAELYQSNLIDNHCAINWTLQEAEVINFTLVLKKNFHDKPIKRLQPSKIHMNQSALDMQKWFSLAWNCLLYLENRTHGISTRSACMAFDLDFDDSVEKDIYKIILTEPNVNAALDKIQSLLEFHV